MASLRAKGRLQPSSYEGVSKVLSLSGFVILMAVGWIALCYVRSNLERHPNNSTRSSEASLIEAPAQPQAQTTVNLVYSAASDKIYYHRPNHLPENGERNALGEDAARRLGLKPCPICIHREMRPQSTAEIERRGASESPK